jgi:epoxide hydrolase-like predicted phosphatase
VADRTGLIVDFGGVLTNSIFETFSAFCAAEGLAPETLRERFAGDTTSRKLLEDFECGTLAQEEFERGFAGVLGVEAEGLVDRIFAGMHPDEEMVSAVQAARAAGIRTGLLSNSWGTGWYDRAKIRELFDGWVISGEVGIRKPEPRIYELAAGKIGLPPHQCVFVDDLPFNLKPARAMGMATVLHKTAAETVPQLEELLGISLR